MTHDLGGRSNLYNNIAFYNNKAQKKSSYLLELTYRYNYEFNTVDGLCCL